MRYAQPEHSIEIVNRSGKTLVNYQASSHEDIEISLSVIDNWRAAHAYPAQSFYVTLKRRACKVHKQSLVAQRIKRLPSIVSKLERESSMKLSQMQDIGGCRAVVQTVSQVRQLESEIENIRWKHIRLKPKDYITHPKESGYRGIHLKYKYVGTGKKSPYSGLKIELQLRTALQHRWATAVEAADTFTKQSLKSSRGSKDWQRFFALMSSIFALKEKSALVPGTPSSREDLVAEIKDLNSNHHIATLFSTYAAIFPRVENTKDAAYFLVNLDPIAKTAWIRGFKKEESQKANAAYTAAEKNLAPDSPTQIVLVSVSSVAALKRVYPNYFLDTTAFLADVNVLINS